MPKGFKGFQKGHIPWHKGKTDVYSEETRISMGAKNLGKKFSIEHKNKMSKAKIGNQNSKGYKQSKEHIRKALRRNPKSSLEIKFEKIINELNLPYKFVDNGDFFIERKCPDFVNVNGEKIAVEVFYRKHKEQFRNGVENWKQERAKIFSNYGWKLKFFNEIEVNEKNILTQLGGV